MTSILLKRAASNKNKNSISHSEYPPQLKAFAFNMYFYSPKAYNYLRSVFHYALPHSRTILSWLSSVNANPGFLTESFKAIEEFVRQYQESLVDGYLLSSFIMDEVSIKKQIDLVPGSSGTCFIFF